MVEFFVFFFYLFFCRSIYITFGYIPFLFLLFFVFFLFFLSSWHALSFCAQLHWFYIDAHRFFPSLSRHNPQCFENTRDDKVGIKCSRGGGWYGAIFSQRQRQKGVFLLSPFGFSLIFLSLLFLFFFFSLCFLYHWIEKNVVVK